MDSVRKAPDAAPVRGSIPLYLLQLAGVADFFLRGFFFTARNAVRPGTRDSGACAAARTSLAEQCETHFGWLERSGLLEVSYEGFQELEKLRGAVLVANHPGLFDALLIYRRFPRAACVMRSGLRNNLCFRGYARECGFLPNDSGRGFLDAAQSALLSGDNLLIFPEGTRTQPGQVLNPFLRGFAHAAVRLQTPVRTVLIRQEGNYLRKGTSLLAPARLPVRIHLSLGEEFFARPAEKASEFCGRVRAWFLDRLGEQEQTTMPGARR